MPPLDNEPVTSAPAPVPAPETPASAPPADAPTSSLDAEIDAQLAALAAEGIAVDDIDVPSAGTIDVTQAPGVAQQPAAPAPVAGQPPAQAAPAPGQQPAGEHPMLRMSREIAARDLEIARLNGIEQGRQQAAAAQPAAPAQPARPQPTPRQIMAHFDSQRADLDKKFDAGEMEAPDYRKATRVLDRQEMSLIADVRAQAHVAPVANHVRQIPAPAPATEDMWLKERSAEMMAADPWLAKVPTKILNSFRDDAIQLAQTNGLDVSPNTAQGLYNYRRCVRAVAKAHNMHLAYGETGHPGQAAAAPSAVAPSAPVPGSQPIPAPRLTQPPSLLQNPGGLPAPIGGMTADRLSTMPFWEAANSMSEAELEAMATAH